MTDWLVNGRPDGTVAPDDRGLLYGDGLFETIAFHGGRSRLWPLHMRRLRRGCEHLGFPMTDEAVLAREAAELVRDRPRAVVRITLTRGRGGRAYFPPNDPQPTRILMRREWPAEMQQRRDHGVALVTSRSRLAAGPGGDLKHLARLPQVLIAAETARAGAEEALVLDADGFIVEALTGNVVIVRDGALLAPGPHPAAVAGVGLEWLRRRAAGDLEERPVAAHELRETDSVWVINSIAGPCPVHCLDERTLPGDGQIRSWQSAWRREVE